LDRARAGLVFALAAYLWWGFIALYFKLVSQVPPIQILAHRVVWSLLLLVVLTFARSGAWAQFIAVTRSRRTMVMLLTSTIFLSLNWFVFIYSVTTGRVVEASLGYFINPLVNVLLGMMFLRERLRWWQAVGLILAIAGVSYLTWSRGQVPWIALALGTTFGLYGLMRKITPVGSMPGLTVETALLLAPALLVIETGIGGPRISYDVKLLAELSLAGVVTAVPLLFFAAAARRLRLTTMGFIQYVSPTGQFLLAVFVFREPFHRQELVSFGLIWAALVIYSSDSYLAYRATPSFTLASKARDQVVEPA
jgi:chloramphenicol-sensitive protein RarD